MLDLGSPPTRPGVAVDLCGLDQVIDYPARDMTITVQAGLRFARLREVLAKENQRLPIDVPRATDATVGGALATNTSGPLRYGHGTLRDYVLGVSVVNGEGSEVKAGGRVVKNVAGYDLCKLHVGALGTLGVITQVTFKVRPQAEERAVVLFGCTADGLAPALERLNSSATRPVCLEVLNSPAARVLGERGAGPFPRASWAVIVGLEGNRDAVGWQVQQLVKELSAWGLGLEARLGAVAEPLGATLVEGAAGSQDRLTVKANLPPSAVAAFANQVAALPADWAVQAHAGSGIVWGHADLTLGQARAQLPQLLSWSGDEGNVVVRRCPAAWKAELSVWGKPRGDRAIMRAVKQALDPHDIFNPGRFVGGL
jgi:glycolate oxidase FAD binding subunit